MQADQHNYQPDEQLTNRGWDEMLKTLDKEMPVQKKKRRGFFWLIPFLLIGGMASVWVFYPNNQKVEIAQNQNQNQNKNSETPSGNNLVIENKNIASENKTNKTIINNALGNNKTKIADDFPSIIEYSNSLLPKVIEEVFPVGKNEIIENENPLAKLGIEIFSIDPSFITLQLQKQDELVIEEKEYFFEDEIVEIPKSIKRKTAFGIFVGVVGDFAKIKKPGLMTGAFVHFPIGKKLGLKTGLGYSQLQKELPFHFIGNQAAALTDEFLNDVSLVVPPPFSKVAVQSRTDFILEKYHQLDVPILLTYSPNKKIEFQLGANASYLIKNKIRLVYNNLYINESVNDDYSNYGIELDALDLNSISQRQYADENYWAKLNVSAVAGLAWKPTRRINLALQYHHGFLPILKSSSNSGANSLGNLTDREFEVYDNSNSGSFNPDLQTPSSDFKLFGKKLFSNEKFKRYNYSLRFSIGYNF